MNQKMIVGLLVLFAILAVIVVAFIILKPLFTPANPADNKTIGDLPTTTGVELTVQAEPSAPYDTVGQVIQFSYIIKNTGTAPLAGIISVTGAAVTCPDVNMIGNLDNFLDVNETLTCSSTYGISQADLDVGDVTSLTTANVNGTLSPPVTTTIPMVQHRLLTLTKTTDPQTFDHVGQTIIYTYVLTNSGNVTLGPAQFSVNDTGLLAPFDCGAPNTSLAPNETVTCSAEYIVTQADLDAASITSSVTASGGGIETSSPVSVGITKGGSVPSTPSDVTPGTTIQHRVVDGEWLWQIARCYGADPKQVIQANPQLEDASQISPGITVSVPNVGSAGTNYGPPCVATYTVQAGDTWNSIAQKYDADIVVLRRVNPGTLKVGSKLIIPLHSAGG